VRFVAEVPRNSLGKIQKQDLFAEAGSAGGQAAAARPADRAAVGGPGIAG